MSYLHEIMYKDTSVFRNEIKFKVFNTSIFDITQNIKRNSTNFFEEYPERWVNNIYFDNSYLDSLNQSIEGSYMRCKTRLRWYGNYLDFSNPNLEFKIKKGYMNTKSAYSCSYLNANINSPFKINNISDLNPLPKMILKDMYPIISNRYYRKYLVSSDKKVRITIDSDLNFSSLRNNSLNKIIWKKEKLLSIIEIKFKDFANAPRTLMTLLQKHYLLSQISKYSYGIQLI